MRYPDWPVGRVAHAEDCKSLYIGSIPVPASNILFRLSSAVEQSAVNRLVACSNQAAGAIKKHHLLSKMVFFLCFWILVRTGCSISGSRMKTTAAPVVFTARGAVLLSSARCISKQSAIYKTSDRRAVSECFARTY